LKYFALGFSTCLKLFLPSPCFTLKVRSGLKENCPLKPQWKVSFKKGQQLSFDSLPQGFLLQFSQIQPDFINDFASWIFHLWAGLIFAEKLVLCLMGEPMEEGGWRFSRCLTLLSPSCSQVLSLHSWCGCAVTASHELCLYQTGTDFSQHTGKSWASPLLRV